MASIENLFSKGAPKNVEDMVKLILKANDATEKLLKSFVDLNKQLAKQTGAKKTAENQKKLTDAEKLAVKQNKQLEAAINKKAEAMTKTGKAIIKERMETQKLTTATKQNIKITTSAKGSYDQLDATLRKDIKSFRALSEAERKNSAEGKRLKKSINDNQKALKKLDSQMGNNQRNVGNYKDAIKGLGVAMVALVGVAGIKKLMGFLSGSITLFDAEIVAQTKLKTALGYTSKALLKQADALQEQTRYGNEAIIGGQAFLAQMKLTEDQIEKITPLVLDFAAGYGYEVNSAFQLVAKTIGSSTNALSRYGITVEGAVGSNERLQSAMDALGGAFEGNAKALALIGAGPMQQLSNLWGDLRENVGQFIARSLNPLIKGLSNLIKIENKESDELRRQQIEFNILAKSIQSSNNTEETRKKLIDELNKKYPDLVKNIDLEKASTKELNTWVDKVNKGYEERIVLITAQEIYKDYVKQVIELKRQEIGFIKTIEGINQGLIGGAEEATGTAADVFISSENLYNSQTAALQKNRDKQKIIYEQMAADVKLLGVDLAKLMGGDGEEDEEEGATDNKRVTIKKLKSLDLEYALSKVELEKLTDAEILDLQAEFLEAYVTNQDSAEQKLADLRQARQDAIFQGFEIVSLGYQTQLNMLSQQKEYELSLVEGNEDAKAAIEEKFRKKQNAAKRKQAIADKGAAVVNTIINTAQSIIKTGATLGYPLAIPFQILAGVLGAAQIAVIASQPIPQFKHGTKDSPEGWADVGEIGQELIISPSGGTTLSGKKRERRWLDRGSQVIPNKETEQLLSAAAGYDSFEVMQLAGVIRDENSKTRQAIKDKRELTIVPGKQKINERKGKYFVEYLNAKFEA